MSDLGQRVGRCPVSCQQRENLLVLDMDQAVVRTGILLLRNQSEHLLLGTRGRAPILFRSQGLWLYAPLEERGHSPRSNTRLLNDVRPAAATWVAHAGQRGAPATSCCEFRNSML